MKILMLQDDFPPQGFGGAEASTFELAQGLQRAGEDVFVVTTCRKKSDEGKTTYQELKVFRIFADYHERYRAYLSLYNPQTVGKVRQLIKEFNPDIVHAHNIHNFLSWHCLKIAKELGKPVFFTARDVMSFSYGKLATKKYLEQFNCRTSWWDHLKQAKKRYNPFRNILIKKYLGYVDQKITVSYALKSALEQNGIKDFEVSYIGINTDDWQVSPEFVEKFKEKHELSGKSVIFFGGRISGLKGLKQINRAMEKVKKEVPEAHLLMSGTGGIGWLTGSDLRAAYHLSNVVVFPSVCFDGLGRGNLEAMACKKPVVGTCFGGVPEVIRDGVTGFVVNPFKIESMAERIIDLLKNREKAKQFGEAGFQRVKQHFNLDSQVAQTISRYQKYD